ncbi:MAG: ABC transporter permease, partial [Planctomycetes bacterium]|nr:ABC transporter permease [Planctomycetota bacterium]
FVFGAIIALVSCYKGFQAGEGAEGVGRAATESVVVSFMSILIANFFLTLMMG